MKGNLSKSIRVIKSCQLAMNSSKPSKSICLVVRGEMINVFTFSISMTFSLRPNRSSFEDVTIISISSETVNHPKTLATGSELMSMGSRVLIDEVTATLFLNMAGLTCETRTTSYKGILRTVR